MTEADGEVLVVDAAGHPVAVLIVDNSNDVGSSPKT